MSRAGRASGAQAKRREVQARVAAAAAEHAAPTEEAPAPPEMPPNIEAQFRAQRLYNLCKGAIVRRHPPLWPPDAIGMAIAEQWLQNLARGMQEAAAEQMRARAAEAGLVIPS